MHPAHVPGKGGQGAKKGQVCSALSTRGAASTPGRLDQWPARQVQPTISPCPPSPNLPLKSGNLVVGRWDSAYVPTTYYAPLCPEKPTQVPFSPWPPSNESESGCCSLIGCSLLASYWLQRGGAGPAAQHAHCTTGSPSAS